MVFLIQNINQESLVLFKLGHSMSTQGLYCGGSLLGFLFLIFFLWKETLNESASDHHLIIMKDLGFSNVTLKHCLPFNLSLWTDLQATTRLWSISLDTVTQNELTYTVPDNVI